MTEGGTPGVRVAADVGGSADAPPLPSASPPAHAGGEGNSDPSPPALRRGEMSRRDRGGHARRSHRRRRWRTSGRPPLPSASPPAHAGGEGNRDPSPPALRRGEMSRSDRGGHTRRSRRRRRPPCVHRGSSMQ